MIKDALEELGIVADEETICEFLSLHKDLLLRLWGEFSEQEEQSEFSLLAEQQNEGLTVIPEIIEINMATIPEYNKDKEKQQKEAFALELKSIPLSFKNGKVNQDYSTHLDFTKINLSRKDLHFEIHNLEEIGLFYDKEKAVVIGKPNQAGDFRIKLVCIDTELGTFEKDITLIINPDPQSLWNNIPTSDTIEYFKPDKEFLEIKRDRTITGASIRGRSHAHEGKPRDDEFQISFVEETAWYLLSVADGAGSSPYSRMGSKIACNTVIEHCESKLKNDTSLLEAIKNYSNQPNEGTSKAIGDLIYQILGGAAFAAHKAIEIEAKATERSLKDYATTLIVSIAKQTEYGWFIASFWIGDGGIGIYNKGNQTIKIQGEPDGGEFAGQTRFLTMGDTIQAAELYRRLRFDLVPNFTAIVLLTDGITDPRFETDANLQNVFKWNELWEGLSTVLNAESTERENLLFDWLSFWSPGNHDDRTIAVLF